MSSSVVKFGFIAGEISPTLVGRTDLAKYDMALAQSTNWFVDYRGGLSTRPGTLFSDFHKNDTLPIRMWPFNFSPTLTNNYVLIFGDGYVRFANAGALVLSPTQNIVGISQAIGAIVTVPAHGLSNGNWVKINNVVGMTQVNTKTYQIASVTTNTFELLDLPGLTPTDSTTYSAYTSGGTISPVYEIASPYSGTDLAALHFDQYADLVRICSPNYPPYDLTRIGNANWTLTPTVIGTYVAGPVVSYGTASSLGTAEVVFAATAILQDGTETPFGTLYRFTSIVDYAAVQGAVSVKLSKVAGAVKYYVYRSIIADSVSFDEGAQLGYVGTCYGSSFQDSNIAADYTKGPPSNIVPFQPGTITFIEVSTGGTGYTQFGTTVSVTDPTGTGFVGQVVVDSTGAVVNVLILNGGENYSQTPTFTFSTGTGAAATATVNPLTGSYPTISIIHQQRQLYAASLNYPVTIWGSQIDRYGNFNVSLQQAASDSFTFKLDTQSVAPIVHLLSARGGLLAFTAQDVWLLNGGNVDAALTPTNALAEPQTYVGVNRTRPIFIGADILYCDGKCFTVQLISFNQITQVYSGDDKSVLASHLFGVGHNIVAWAYQETPFRIVWAVREDGVMLAFTIVKAQDVFAWTQVTTRGLFLDVVVIREDFIDRVYVTVKRFINNRWTQFFEELDLRQFVNMEDAICLDAALTLTPNQPNANITVFQSDPGNTDNVVTIVADAGVFTGSVGNYLRAGNGVFLVQSVTSPTQVVVLMTIPPTNWIPETNQSMSFPVVAGDWSLDTPSETFSGLWHLEGESVGILGDGNVFPNQTVVNGSITLSHPVSRACIGINYTCTAQTLPVIIPNQGIEANRKRAVGVGVRFNQSRGLTYGRTLQNLYAVRERTTEPYGQATRMLNGIKYLLLDPNWEEDTQTYFVQSNPLPATLLSIVTDIEVGDEPN